LNSQRLGIGHVEVQQVTRGSGQHHARSNAVGDEPQYRKTWRLHESQVAVSISIPVSQFLVAFTPALIKDAAAMAVP
jgi:hypothetical protein